VNVASRSHKLRPKWKKVRSGRRILGTIREDGAITHWKSNGKVGSGDYGVSGTREQAVNNVLKAMGGTSDGYRRQFEVDVED
jgi:hypothetical protein